jgi:hypothetical protein
MRLLLQIAFAGILSVSISACAGSGGTVDRPDVVTPPSEVVDLRAVETFDPSLYSIEAPPAVGNINHDVPEQLMTGSMEGDRTLRSVSGFRIQIHSSLIKDEAVTKETQVQTWWNSLLEGERPAGLGSSEIAVYLYFHSPYYRVRIGNFGQRSEAETALSLVRESFPSAFITVDTVDIYR